MLFGDARSITVHTYPYTLNVWLPADHFTDYVTASSLQLTHTSTGNLETPINLAWFGLWQEMTNK